jgi:hypoxanthine phosphoribosyltransferase
MAELIAKLPDWLIISLFILLSVIIVFVIVALTVAIVGGREIKIGPVRIGKKEESDPDRYRQQKEPQEISPDADDRISWAMLEKEILKIKDRLISDQYVPTLIVGIGRGGAVVSALLSGCLGSIPIIVIERLYHWNEEGRNDEMMLKNIDLSKYNDKVLLVAGELHTGNTAKMYKQHFKDIESKSVKMYAFFKEHYPAFQPDYFSIENDKPDIKLPWMITENYKRQSLINENAKS